MAGTLAFEAALNAQNFLNGIRQMITGMNQADAAAQKSGSTISAGLEKSLLGGKGNYAKIGQDIGGTITQGLTSSFGMAGNVAGSVATALGPVGIAGLAAGAGVLAVGSALSTATGVATGFEKAISGVAAITGEAADTQFEFEGEMTTLADVARQAGATSVYSASQAADAMTQLASTGMNNQQIATALPATLNLAAAGNMDFARATEITASSLQQFSLNADQAGRVSNVYAAVAAKSATSIDDLGYAMTYVGPVAGALGISIEQTSAALGVLANAGFKGTLGGTALRGALSDLMNLTPQSTELLEKFGLTAADVDPKTHSLADIVDLFNSRGMGAAEMMKIFGERGGPGMLALLSQGGGAIRQMEKDITGTSYAEDMATTQTKNLWGAQKMMASAFEEAQISVGNLIIPLQTVATQGFTAFVLGATEAGKALYGLVANSDVMSSLGQAATSVGEAVSSVFGNMAEVISPVWDALGGGEAAMGGLQAAFNVLTAPLNAAVQGIKLLADGIKAFETAAKPVATFIGSTLGNAITTAKAYLQALSEAFKNLATNNSTIQGLISAFDNFKTKLGEVANFWKNIGSKIVTSLAESIPKALSGLITALQTLMGKAGKAANDAFAAVIKDTPLGAFLGFAEGVSARASEITSTGKDMGDKVGEGIKASEELAKAPGEALSSDAAMEGVEDAADTAAEKYAKEQEAWLKANSSQFEAGMTLIDILDPNGIKIGQKWVSNQDTEEVDDLTRSFDYLGKKIQFVKTAVNPTNFQWKGQIWSDGVLLGETPVMFKEDIDPEKTFETVTGLPAPKEGTAAYFKLVGNYIAAEKVEMLEELQGTEPENLWDVKDSTRSIYKFMEANKDIVHNGGEELALTLYNAMNNDIVKESPTLQESLSNVMKAISSPGSVPATILNQSLADLIDAGVLADRWSEKIKEASSQAKDVLASGIVDAGKFAKSQASDIGGQISRALSDGFLSDTEISSLAAFCPMLQVLREKFPEEFKAAGLDSIMAFIEAAQNGASPEELYALAQQLGLIMKEGFKSAITGMTYSIETTSVADLLKGGTKALKSKIGDLSNWNKNVFIPTLKDDFNKFNKLYKTGYNENIKSTESWLGDLKSRQQEYSEYLPKWFNALIDGYRRGIYDLSDVMTVLDALLNETDAATKKQSTGYDNLKKTIEDCADCAISEFGKWQEAQENLFQPSYIGEGGANYEAWKGNQIAAIRETQEAMDRVGGAVVGKRYTGSEYDWADQFNKQITITADTSGADSSIAATQANLSKLVQDAKQGADLKLDTSGAQANLDSLINSIQANQYQTIYVETIHYDTYAGTNEGPGNSNYDAFGGSGGPGIPKIFPSYQEGTDFVPRTGHYLLHEGEKVTPAGEGSGGINIQINAPMTVQGDINGVDNYEELLDKRDASLRKEFNAALIKVAKA